MSTRVIHTGLYAARANSLFSVIIDNMKRCYSNAKQTKKMASLLNTNVKLGVDNEILFKPIELQRVYLTDKEDYCYTVKKGSYIYFKVFL